MVQVNICHNVFKFNEHSVMSPNIFGERDGLVVNASDHGSRGLGFEPHPGQPHCVRERGTFTPQKALVIHRKRWLRPNMTEKIVNRVVKNQSTNQTHSIKCHWTGTSTISAVIVVLGALSGGFKGWEPLRGWSCRFC